MSRRMLPGLLLCLVGGIAWWVLGADRNISPPEDGTERGGTTRHTAMDAIPSAAEESTSPIGALQRDDLGAAGTSDSLDMPSVMGTVSWMDDRPAAGIALQLLNEDTSTLLDSTVTDEDGRYRLAIPADHPHEDLSMYQVVCPGWSAEDTYYTAMPQVPADHVDIRIADGFPLRVLAIDHHDGLPVEGAFIYASDTRDSSSDILATTGADGIAILRMPTEDAWEFIMIGGYFGLDASEYSVHWVDRSTEEVRIAVASAPDALSLQVIDAASGSPVPDASFRPATAPEDLTSLDPIGLAVLPEDWSASGGRLDLQFLGPGRVFLHVSAPGYLPEVVEWISDDRRTHEVPLLPLRGVEVRVTRHGEPVQATVTTAVNRKTKVLPEGELHERIANRPYSGGLVDHTSDPHGHLTLLLPDPDLPGAPKDFDLWMQVEDRRRYFGTLSWHRLPEPPWHFEMDPPTGEILVEATDTDGEPMPNLSFFVSAEADDEDFDSIRMGQYPRQSTILKTDAEGRARAQLPAPSRIRLTGTYAEDTDDVVIVRDLEAEGSLHLPIQVDRPDRGEGAPPTRGRVEFLGASEEAFRETLWLQLHPLDEVARESKDEFLGIFPVHEDLAFELWTRPGRWRAWCNRETLETATANGRYVDFQAGEQEVILRLPVPYALKVRVVDGQTMQGVTVDDVIHFGPTGKRFFLDTWEGDFALSYTLFQRELDLVATAEGYAPGFASTSLRDGILNEVTIKLEPGRDLPVRVHPEFPRDGRLTLRWIDAPDKERGYVFYFHEVLYDAPTGKAHLRAYLDGQPLHDIHLDEESTEIVIDLGASQYFPPEDGR